VQVQVKLFGPLAQAAATRTASVELPAGQANCAALREALTRRYPQLRDALATCRLAVNHEFVGDATPIALGDEVALIGQVSGG